MTGGHAAPFLVARTRRPFFASRHSMKRLCCSCCCSRWSRLYFSRCCWRRNVCCFRCCSPSSCCRCRLQTGVAALSRICCGSSRRSVTTDITAQTCTAKPRRSEGTDRAAHRCTTVSAQSGRRRHHFCQKNNICGISEYSGRKIPEDKTGAQLSAKIPGQFCIPKTFQNIHICHSVQPRCFSAQSVLLFYSLRPSPVARTVPCGHIGPRCS